MARQSCAHRSEQPLFIDLLRQFLMRVKFVELVFFAKRKRNFSNLWSRLDFTKASIVQLSLWFSSFVGVGGVGLCCWWWWSCFCVVVVVGGGVVGVVGVVLLVVKRDCTSLFLRAAF